MFYGTIHTYENLEEGLNKPTPELEGTVVRDVVYFSLFQVRDNTNSFSNFVTNKSRHMKKTLLLAAICSWLAASNAQTDSTQIKLVTQPDSTAIGSPDGTPVSKEIGPAGGEIVSEDGRVKLIFPAGALTDNTNIRIQPAENLAPNGSGKAYWFEPSGIQFNKPVRIIFQYTGDESEICPPEWMSLGMQDQNGKWTFTDYDEWDSTAKQLKGFIRHFSGASNINDVQLRPDRNELGVNDFTYIDVVDISILRPPELRVYEFAELNNNAPVLWYANEVLNGNAKTGRIRMQQVPQTRATRVMTAVFTAPEYLPPINAVAIWAEVYRKTKKGKTLMRRLRCYIEIYDVYKVKIEHEFTGREDNGSKLIDSASFVVTVFANRVKIGQIQNYEPIVIKAGSRAGFTEIFNTNGARGTIHITENIKNDSLSNDYPPEVYFEFQQREVLRYRWQCRLRGGITTDIVSMTGFPIHDEINFIANGRQQRYNVTTGNKVTYKLIVTPYRK